ncbi:MAG: heme-binding protein [Synechococcaceae cyanobacterium]|nr:heme-binding protein [Synechococcaceae cyanobacterium]
MRQIPQLQLADCRALVAAAAAEASGRQATVSIAVVDPGGQPLLLQRGDGASPASTAAALAKAAMAALNGKPTAALEAAINGERPALLQLALSLPVPAVAMAGGLPLLLDGVCLGGIGVSGMTPDIDGAIAAAGVAALIVTPPV